MDKEEIIPEACNYHRGYKNQNMQRRKFVRDAGIFAISIGVFGNVQSTGRRFTGDTPTTTDILGPFYRPGAPIRININPPGFSGEKLHLSGSVFKEDLKTPFKNCLIEIWQCNKDKVYDNTSDNYESFEDFGRGSAGSDHTNLFQRRSTYR
jgi:protocatechuate 3,4-dioxygenase beta subunit